MQSENACRSNFGLTSTPLQRQTNHNSLGEIDKPESFHCFDSVSPVHKQLRTAMLDGPRDETAACHTPTSNRREFTDIDGAEVLLSLKTPTPVKRAIAHVE